MGWLFLATSVYAQAGSGPTNLRVSLVGQNRLELTWDAPAVDVASVSHYNIRYNEQTGDLRAWGNGTYGALGTATRAEVVLGNRSRARYYTYRMHAVRNGVESEWSNSVTYDADGDTVVELPVAPGRLTALPRDGEVGLSWDDPSDATIVVYQLRFTPGGVSAPPDWTHVVWSDIAGSDAVTTVHAVAELTDGTEYTFEVRARNAAGVGDSSVVTATPGLPSPPVNLSATPGDASVRLTWDNPGDVTITGYQVRYSDATGLVQDWTDISLSDQYTTGHEVTGLTNWTEYTFELRAVNGAGPGGSSHVVETPGLPPGAPSGLTWTPGDASVNLSWDDPADDSIEKYQLKYGDATGLIQDWTDISLSDQYTTDHEVTGLTNGTEYTVEVRAVNAAGDGQSSSVTAMPGPPLAPANLTSSVGGSWVMLTWDDPMNPSITGYEVRHGDGHEWEQDWMEIVLSDANTTEHTVGDLELEREYVFQVRAVNAAGAGEASEVTGKPQVPPSAPSGLTAISGDGFVTLSWDDPAYPGLIGYQVRYVEGTMPLPETWEDIEGSHASTTSHTVGNLTNGRSYRFEVRGVNEAGPGESAGVTGRPGGPQAPAGLSASAGEAAVTLSWEDPDDGTITVYEVRYDERASGLPGVWEGISHSDSSTTRHEVTGLTNGTRYTFEVRAVNAVGPGASSGLTAAPGAPGAPEGLGWSQAHGLVTLTWDDPDNAAVAGYQIRYREGATGNPSWTDIRGSNANTTRHEVSGLTNVTSYTFELRAFSDAGFGPTASVMPMTPKAPAGLRATAGVNEVTLTWTDADDASISGYEIRYGDGVTWDPDWTEIDPSNANTTRHEVTGLTNGEAYAFELRALNSAGPGPAASAAATPMPAAPANLAAEAGVNQVTLTWSDPGDAAVTVYQLIYYSGSRPSQPVWNDLSGTVSHAVMGLKNGTEYTFELRAKATATPGDSSVAMAAPKPAAPANLEAAAGVNQVTLAWDDPGDAEITMYQIRYAETNASLPAWSDVPGSRAGTADYTVTGLKNGTEYTFELRAKATATPGDSSVATGTPVPDAPANLQAAAGVNQVTLAWTDPGGRRDHHLPAQVWSRDDRRSGLERYCRDWRNHDADHGDGTDERDGVYVRIAGESNGHHRRFGGGDGRAETRGACQPECDGR